LVVVALANKMARIIWTMTVGEETYRNPAAAVCDGRRDDAEDAVRSLR
jgi:hypothetical protein